MVRRSPQNARPPSSGVADNLQWRDGQHYGNIIRCEQPFHVIACHWIFSEAGGVSSNVVIRRSLRFGIVLLPAVSLPFGIFGVETFLPVFLPPLVTRPDAHPLPTFGKSPRVTRWFKPKLIAGDKPSQSRPRFICDNDASKEIARRRRYIHCRCFSSVGGLTPAES